MGAPASSRSLDALLLERLSEHVVDDVSYWDFRKNDRRSHGHALFPYPAMMVPQLQGALLDDLLAVDPSVEWCYDPFAGSGTILTECMRRGLNFIGSDLNPLAVLIMTVKARPLREQTLHAAVARVLTTARRRRAVPVEFRGRDKWFSANAVDGLSRLRAAIHDEPGRPTRRFLWVCLAATVRLVSNSRTSTFKLHTYPTETLSTREVRPIETFERLAEAAVEQMNEQHAELTATGRLAYGRYEHDVQVRHADVLSGAGWPKDTTADVLMTSPPYGDNRTTVPYGQHSYLPLMWIDQEDLPVEGDIASLVGNPYRLDVASIGGRRVGDADARLRELAERSPMVRATADALAGVGGDGVDRFVAFCSDMDKAVEIIAGRLRPGAFQFWTLGNRRICGQVVPTSRIVSELSASRGATELVTIHRRFPRNAKRMAARNDTVALMDTEQILVMQSSTVTSAPSAPTGAEKRSRHG